MSNGVSNTVKSRRLVVGPKPYRPISKKGFIHLWQNFDARWVELVLIPLDWRSWFRDAFEDIFDADRGELLGIKIVFAESIKSPTARFREYLPGQFSSTNFSTSSSSFSTSSSTSITSSSTSTGTSSLIWSNTGSSASTIYTNNVIIKSSGVIIKSSGGN